MYSLNMLAIALELAVEDPVYEDIATKFFEHFLYIAGALNGHSAATSASRCGTTSDELLLRHRSTSTRATCIPLKVRSLVGLIPLLAVETLEPRPARARCPDFRRRLRWFLANRPELAASSSSWEEPGRRASGGCSRSSTAIA